MTEIVIIVEDLNIWLGTIEIGELLDEEEGWNMGTIVIQVI